MYDIQSLQFHENRSQRKMRRKQMHIDVLDEIRGEWKMGREISWSTEARVHEVRPQPIAQSKSIIFHCRRISKSIYENRHC